MDETNLYVALGGVVSTISTSLLAFLKGKRQRKITENNEIIKQYEFALNSLREEFERRISEMQEQIDTLKQHICYVSSCKKRKV